MTTLVYFSPVNWSGLSHRSHEMVAWLQARSGCDVIWVNPYAARLPKRGDVGGWRLENQKLSSIHPKWLREVTIPALPIEPLPVVNRLNRLIWFKESRALKKAIKDEGSFVLVAKPSRLVLSLLGTTNNRVTYDIMDDFPAFYTGLNARSMEKIERLVLERVSEVTCSSTQLVTKFGQFGKDVELVRNGFAMEDEYREMRKTPPPKTIFGYVGTIGSWFDWAAIISLANANPSSEIQIMGPVHSPPSQKLPSNISLLGQKPNKEARRHMRDFSFGLIPFKDNPLTHSVDPIKFYEYLASGVPVLTTLFGEMRNRVKLESDGYEALTSSGFNGAVIHSKWNLFLPRSDFDLGEYSWVSRFSKSSLICKLAETLAMKETRGH